MDEKEIEEPDTLPQCDFKSTS